MNRKTLFIFAIVSVVVAAIIYREQTIDSYSVGLIAGRATWLFIAPLIITYIIKGIMHLFRHGFSVKAFRVVYAAFWVLVAVSNLSTASA